MDDRRELDVYDHGHGWRVAFPFAGAVRVLTVEEVEELLGMLHRGIRMICEKIEEKSHDRRKQAIR